MWYLGNTLVVERNYGLVFSGFFFTILAFIVVCMRVFARLALVRNVGIDDSIIAVAMVGSIGFLTACFFQIRYGLGFSVLLDELVQFLMSLYFTVVFYSFTQMAVKFSIAFQYYRIFQSSMARKILVPFMCWLLVYGLFCLGSSIITCWPIAKYWDDSIPGGCIDRSVLHYVLAGFNIINDFVLLCFPFPYFRNLKIAPKAKAILIGVFACGAFACIVSVIRLRSLYVNNSAPIEQQPIFGVDIALWSGLEINIAIICASVPALKPLVVRVFPGLRSLGSSSGSKPYGRGTNGSMPLHSFDARGTGNRSVHDVERMEIKVHQSIEMKSMPVDDDGSERNLVNVASSWMADVSAQNKVSSNARGTMNG